MKSTRCAVKNDFPTRTEHNSLYRFFHNHIWRLVLDFFLYSLLVDFSRSIVFAIVSPSSISIRAISSWSWTCPPEALNLRRRRAIKERTCPPFVLVFEIDEDERLVIVDLIESYMHVSIWKLDNSLRKTTATTTNLRNLSFFFERMKRRSRFVFSVRFGRRGIVCSCSYVLGSSKSACLFAPGHNPNH